MVLLLKHWKSRSSPGIAARVRNQGKPIHTPHRLVLANGATLRKAERPPEPMRGQAKAADAAAGD